MLWQGLEIQASTESRASSWLTGWGNGSPLPFWPPAVILQWKTTQRDDGAEGFAGGLLPCPSSAKDHRRKKCGYCYSATSAQGQCFYGAHHATPSMLVLLLVIKIYPTLFTASRCCSKHPFHISTLGCHRTPAYLKGGQGGKCHQTELVSMLDRLGVRCSLAAIVGKVWLLVSSCPAGSVGCWGGTSRAGIYAGHVLQTAVFGAII